MPSNWLLVSLCCIVNSGQIPTELYRNRAPGVKLLEITLFHNSVIAKPRLNLFLLDPGTISRSYLREIRFTVLRNFTGQSGQTEFTPVKSASLLTSSISRGRQDDQDVFVCILNFRKKLKIPNRSARGGKSA